MFVKTFIGACLAVAALSLEVVTVADNEITDAGDDQTPAAITEILSQAEAATAISAKICQRAPARNKAAVPDFYKIYGGTSVFTDSAFPHSKKAL